ncbi:hypothetical protein [Couchioplanes caeruleus]|uniref:Uncharacterized protein n=2 Tax=Couchioplanes caeruleus TaxID=56438 RepID=A0A1K0GUH1_9ACTN|nr:hypothetical protein [Couchioplanes caeruleus]OJF13003.1 hypothetical protein BG844_17690 [Couchioplanes caeruleus subsp. caeruleus]
MPDGLQSLNVVKVEDSPLLLTETGGGTAIHPTKRQTSGGREAIDPFYLDGHANTTKATPCSAGARSPDCSLAEQEQAELGLHT